MGLGAVLVGLPLGRESDLERLGLSERDLLGEDSLRAHYQLSRPLLGLGHDVVGGFVRSRKDLGRLDANCAGQSRLVEVRLGCPPLGFGQSLAKHRLALEHVTKLRSHLDQEGVHRLAVDALADRGKGLARYLVRADHGARRYRHDLRFLRHCQQTTTMLA